MERPENVHPNLIIVFDLGYKDNMTGCDLHDRPGEDLIKFVIDDLDENALNIYYASGWCSARRDKTKWNTIHDKT